MKGFSTKKGTLEYQNHICEEINISPSAYREFLGLKLSSLGMGTYLGTPDNKTDKLVEKAVIKSIRGGINVIDTAINYRLQKAERAIGTALQKLSEYNIKREQIFLSTKIGYIPGDADTGLGSRKYLKEIILKKNIANKEEVIGMNCMSPSYIEHQLDQSLKNLGISTIDLLYLHNVADAQKASLGEENFFEGLEKAMNFLEEKVEEQKIKYYGIATWDCLRVNPSSPEYLNLQKVKDLSQEVAESRGKKDCAFKFIMLPYNFQMTEAGKLKNQGGKTVFEKAKELNLGIFSAVPLLQAKALNHPKLKTLRSKFGLETTAQAAIQFVRKVGMPLIAPLVGHTQPEHVKQNLEVLMSNSP